MVSSTGQESPARTAQPPTTPPSTANAQSGEEAALAAARAAPAPSDGEESPTGGRFWFLDGENDGWEETNPGETPEEDSDEASSD
jgi:hypothetical protein